MRRASSGSIPGPRATIRARNSGSSAEVANAGSFLRAWATEENAAAKRTTPAIRIEFPKNMCRAYLNRLSDTSSRASQLPSYFCSGAPIDHEARADKKSRAAAEFQLMEPDLGGPRRRKQGDYHREKRYPKTGDAGDQRARFPA